MTIVIDASIAIAWCFEDEATDVADAVLDRLAGEDAVVPSLWPSEIANVLLVAERRQRLTEAESTRFVELLTRLPIRVDLEVGDVSILTATGRRHALSAYDACYLVLAERLGVELATLDSALAAAADDAGVPVVTG